MRMIDRTRKEGIKNGFHVTLSLLATGQREQLAGVINSQAS